MRFDGANTSPLEVWSPKAHQKLLETRVYLIAPERNAIDNELS